MTLAGYVADLRRRAEEAASIGATAPLAGVLRRVADELELLGAPPMDEAPALLTVGQIAARLTRSPSTVRGWCDSGRFAGAFKLNSRDWRIPAEAVDQFVAAQRAAAGATDLGAWRKERRA